MDDLFDAPDSLESAFDHNTDPPDPPDHNDDFRHDSWMAADTLPDGTDFSGEHRRDSSRRSRRNTLLFILSCVIVIAIVLGITHFMLEI